MTINAVIGDVTIKVSVMMMMMMIIIIMTMMMIVMLVMLVVTICHDSLGHTVTRLLRHSVTHSVTQSTVFEWE